MKSLPATPILLDILKDAWMDSLNFISECEQDLSEYTVGTGVHSLHLECIESRKQKIAIIKDLIERYSE